MERQWTGGLPSNSPPRPSLNAVPNPAAARRPEMKMKGSAISLTEMVILYRQNHGKSWKIMGNILMLAAY